MQIILKFASNLNHCDVQNVKILSRLKNLNMIWQDILFKSPIRKIQV